MTAQQTHLAHKNVFGDPHKLTRNLWYFKHALVDSLVSNKCLACDIYRIMEFSDLVKKPYRYVVVGAFRC